MMRYRLLILALVVLLLPALARAAEETMTLETGGHAIFIGGPEETIEEIRNTIKESPKFKTAKEVEDWLAKKYGDSIHTEIFDTPDAAELAGAKKTVLTVREAVLRGIVPPIEGLAAQEAAMVLKAFGFSVFTKDEFEEMTDSGRIKELYLSEGAALVLSDTGPLDHITMYKWKGAAGETEPAE